MGLEIERRVTAGFSFAARSRRQRRQRRPVARSYSDGKPIRQVELEPQPDGRGVSSRLQRGGGGERQILPVGIREGERGSRGEGER